MPKSVRLFLIDSSVLFRRGLAALLNRRRGFHVVGEAATGADALRQIPSVRPNVVLLGPDVPGGGPELIAVLREEVPECAVLLLTFEPDQERASRALQAGARGILLKACEPGDLAHSIERVHAGELVLAPAVVGLVLTALTADPSGASGLARLTQRELEVLQVVAQGRTNPQIAQELSITEYTVKAHVATILNKLGVENRVQIATYAIERGLVKPSIDHRD